MMSGNAHRQALTKSLALFGTTLACTAAVLRYLIRTHAEDCHEACPLEAVRESTARVLEQAQDVRVDQSAVDQLAQSLSQQELRDMAAPSAFDADLHFVDGSWRTVQYLLVVDTLNFCFWPRAQLFPAGSVPSSCVSLLLATPSTDFTRSACGT